MAERILIIRLSALGDVVFASPLIAAARRRYPDATLSWLVEPAAAPLLRANPALDEVIPWPKADWQRLWREGHWLSLLRAIRSFRRDLRRRRFDLVLDVQGLLKSALLGWFTGAPRRLALDSGEPTGMLVSERLPKPESDRIGSEYLAFSEWAGLDSGDFAMDIALDTRCQALCDAEQAKGSYAVLCAFTTRPQKHWRNDGWRAVARELEGRGLRVLLLGGPGDVDAAVEIVADSAIEDRVGSLKLDETAAVIAGASALVGVDTGLTHMGIAFGVPTVALFGSTCPYLRTTRANARVIYHDLDCAPCRRNPTCDGRFECLTGITPGEIASALDGVLQADASLLVEGI